MWGVSKSGVYYYYRQLSGTDRIVYDALLSGLKTMSADISLPCGDFDTIERVVELVLADHPEIFWFAGAGNMKQRGNQLSFQPTYTMSRMTKDSRERQIANVVSRFLGSVRFCRSDADRLEKAFDYLVKNVTYVDGSPDNQNICSALLNHRSVCAGYAKSLQYLLQQMGVECLHVSGITASKGAHAWNIVKVDGQYYQTDVTFGDRSFSDGTTVGSGLPAELEAEYGYLCMSDAEALRDRRMKTIGGIRMPACSSTKQSWYRRHGLYFSSAEEAWRSVGSSLASNRKYWCGQFASDSAYLRFVQEVNGGKFADLALEKMRLRRVSTSTSKNDSLRIVIGWLR